MRRFFTSLLFICLVTVGATAQNLISSSGNVYLSNWVPAQNNNKFEPTIGNMTVKYSFEPDSLKCKVQMSMQWYLGNAVHYNKEIYKYPIINQPEINNYSIIDLEIQADLYTGNQYIGKIYFDMGTTPQSGGLWGNNREETRTWSNLLNGVSSYITKNAFQSSTSLKNLKIRKVTFGGEHQFKQAAYQKYVTEARTEETNRQWENALSYYRIAKKMVPNDSFVTNKVLTLEQKLAKYQQFIKLGDASYTKKEYLKALTAYQNAEQALVGQDHTQARLKEIEKRIADYDAAKQAASTTFQEAKDVGELIEAKKQFEQALTFLPIDKKAEIDVELKKINELLESEYKHAMDEAKLAFNHQEYAYAAEQYRKASSVFPDRPTPKQRLAACVKPLQDKITATYKQRLAETKNVQTEKLQLVAQAFNAQNEQCYLKSYEKYQCLERYYTTVSKTIDREVKQAVYANTAFQKTRITCDTTACPINQQWETTNQTSDAYLMAAKRKHDYLSRYKADVFKKYRDQYLEQSLAVNPENVDAFLFKAKIAESVTDQLLWYHKVLAFQPNNLEAQNALQRLEGQFMGELFTFIDNNRIDELQKALDLGLLKKSGNYRGQNVVEYVISKDNAPMLALLLEKPAQLAATISTDVNELLCYAVAKKATNCVDELLFNRNANPNHRKQGKEHLLIQAVSNRYSTIAVQLLKAKANPYITNTAGKTSLMLALEAGDEKIVTDLLNYYDIAQVKNQEVFTALRVGNSKIVNHLLDKGVDVNLKNTRGQALIHLAILGQHEALSEVIISHGADLEMRDRDGNTALLLATKQAKGNIAQRLIAKNARINLKNNAGETPLYLSIKNNLLATTAVLLKRQASYEAVFEVSKIRNEGSVGDRMAQALAVLGIREKQDQFITAALQARSDVGYLPKSAYPNVLREAARTNQAATFMRFVEKDPSRVLQPEGLSALHIAIAEKNVEITKRLLDKLLNLRSKTAMGVNPFHYAAQTGFVNGLDVLTKRFDINMQDEKGNTALHHAVMGNQADMIRALLNRGANPKIKNNRKWKPKKLAKKTKKKHLKRLF
ncbi:MAG: ankyrin repeat domain-containing protein [Flammeovirgaceae bacterium]